MVTHTAHRVHLSSAQTDGSPNLWYTDYIMVVDGVFSQVYTTVFKLVWCIHGMALSCCKKMVAFYSALSLEFWAFSAVSMETEWSELMHFLGSINSRRISPFLSQKIECITLTAEGCVWNFFFDREFLCNHSMDFVSFDCLVVMTPHLIIVNDVIQETVTLSLVWLHLFLTNLHSLFFLFHCLPS